MWGGGVYYLKLDDEALIGHFRQQPLSQMSKSRHLGRSHQHLESPDLEEEYVPLNFGLQIYCYCQAEGRVSKHWTLIAKLLTGVNLPQHCDHFPN